MVKKYLLLIIFILSFNFVVGEVECSSDNDCNSGFACNNLGICVEYCSLGNTECSDGIDNDNDGYVDFSGGCDTTNDKIVDYICGCQDDNSGLFSNYGDEDIICGSTETYRCYSFSDVDKDADDVTCNVLSGMYYSSDLECRSPLDTDESEDPECADGIENDINDGIDYPNDSDCSSPEDNSESDLNVESAPEIKESFFVKLFNLIVFWN